MASMTDELIDRLTGDLRPARQGVVPGRLLLGLAAGSVVALVWVVLGLGLRPDFPGALSTQMFWIKLAYVTALGGVSIWALDRLSRPAASSRGRLIWLTAPVVAIAMMSMVQLGPASSPERIALVMGHSAKMCPLLILATAAPIFAALVWALRGLAPTRPRLTGAVTGLAAGGMGAALYALHCPESGAAFVAIWYGLGILAASGAGALLGPRVLRW